MHIEIDTVTIKDSKVQHVHARINQGTWQLLTPKELMLLIRTIPEPRPPSGT